MEFISSLFSGKNLIYTIEGLTFIAILLLMLYFFFTFNLIKKD